MPGFVWQIEGQKWREQAECREADSRLFHRPDDLPRGKNYDFRPAAEYCARCPVRMECLQYALDEPEHHGFYGGFTSFDRKKYVHPEWVRNGERATRELVDPIWRDRVRSRWGEAWLDRNPLPPQDRDMGVALSQP